MEDGGFGRCTLLSLYVKMFTKNETAIEFPFLIRFDVSFLVIGGSVKLERKVRKETCEI